MKSVRRPLSGWRNVEGRGTQDLLLLSARTVSRDVTPAGYLYVPMKIVLTHVQGVGCYSARDRLVARHRLAMSVRRQIYVTVVLTSETTAILTEFDKGRTGFLILFLTPPVRAMVDIKTMLRGARNASNSKVAGDRTAKANGNKTTGKTIAETNGNKTTSRVISRQRRREEVVKR